MLIAGHADDKSVAEGCYTDNYLAKLRDRVVEDKRALIMVHNSSLDTITNSTLDLAHSGAIWSVSSIRNLLEGLIDNSMTNRETSSVFSTCKLRLLHRMVRVFLAIAVFTSR